MTIDDLARVTLLLMSTGLLIVCGLVLYRARWAWRIVVAVALWAISLIAWMLTSLFQVPRDVQLLNWWSRCNIAYSIIIVALMLSLHYAIKVKSNGSGGT